MYNLAAIIKETRISKGQLGVFFMGQAGVILKTPEDKFIAIDLYLSDYCERLVGFKRLMPKLIAPTDISFDAVIATHAHPDHFDGDSIPFMLSKPGARLICTADCKTECDRLAIPAVCVTYIQCGDTVEICNAEVTAVACDHGPSTPDAVGLYINYEGKSVYIAGDTSYRQEIAEQMASYPTIDIAFAPINGAFGNLNEVEAAAFFEIIKPRLCVPCHYWNFAEHGGDPGVFAEEMKKKHSKLSYLLMRAGEWIII